MRTTILVRKGIYKEKVVIPESKINVSLIGQEGAVLSYDDYADKKNVFGETKGTSGSSTCYIYAPDFYAENITFENTAGPVGQAVACFVSADRAFSRIAAFWVFRIRFTLMVKTVASIMRTVILRVLSILFSVGLRLYSIVATSIVRETDI